MTMKPNMYPALLAAVLLIGCAGKSEPSAEASDASGEKMSAPAEATTTSAASDEVSGVNVCELVTSEEVAAAIGGTVLKPSRRSDYGTVQGCEYELDPSGSDNYEYAAIWLNTPDLFEPADARIETNKGLGQESTAEQLSGMGDEAYVIHNTTEEQSDVFVLLKDRLFIEAKAEHDADARKIAQLTLSKL